MGDLTRLTKDGRIELKYWYNESKPYEYRYRDISTVGDLMNNWDTILFLQEGATLGSLFVALNNLQGDKDRLLPLTDCPIQPFLDEGLNNPAESTDMKIVVARSAQISKFPNLYSWDKELGKGEYNHLCIYEDVYGLGPQGEDNIQYYGGKAEDLIRWGISMSPANTLINCELVIDTSLDILYDDIDFGVNKDSEGNYVPNVALSDLHKTFSLGEFIHAIFWELSWYGLPTSRNEKVDEINERIENIKNGKAETKPLNLDDLDPLQDD